MKSARNSSSAVVLQSLNPPSLRGPVCSSGGEGGRYV